MLYFSRISANSQSCNKTNRCKVKTNHDLFHNTDTPCPVLTQASPYEGKQQREQDVTPVPFVFCCYGDDPQEEEDEGLRDGAKHLDHVADGGAGTLGNVFLHIVLHGEGTSHNAAEPH